MPRVYLSDKEAAAVAVILETFLRNNPFSISAGLVEKVPERIRKCLDLQGKKNAAPKDGANAVNR